MPCNLLKCLQTGTDLTAHSHLLASFVKVWLYVSGMLFVPHPHLMKVQNVISYKVYCQYKDSMQEFSLLLPYGLIWWNQLQYASGILYAVACICLFCVLCACVRPQEAIQIQLWSLLGESGEGVATRKWVPTCKIDMRRWGTGEEWRDEWMNKTKSASDWEVPSRILRLYLL